MYNTREFTAAIRIVYHPSSFQKQADGAAGEFEYSTKLFYMVHIRPKGPVPVLALEWQISNEVPNNLAALKKAAESVTPEYVQVRQHRSE